MILIEIGWKTSRLYFCDTFIDESARPSKRLIWRSVNKLMAQQVKECLAKRTAKPLKDYFEIREVPRRPDNENKK
jgi:uncharacterized protein YlaI